MHTTDERVILERLRMVRVAKDLFLSDWYSASCRTLAFSQEACESLARVAEESGRERDDLMDLVQRWARRLEDGGATERTRDVVRVARRDHLLTLIDAKTAAGEALERAALIAPESLREELESLAAQDFAHANELRRLLVAEVQEAWSARELRGTSDP